MDVSVGPQILEHISQSVQITSYDVKWIPSSARFVVMGSYARATGCLQVYELDGTTLKLQKEVETKTSIKCGTFGASGLAERHLATGNFEGYLQMWDLERSDKPVMDVKAHTSIVNAIDGVGGTNKGYGAPEICTCGRDGAVRVWDARQKDAPVASFEPKTGAAARDCWSVAFGNSFNEHERCVLAGYDNGDVKLFDLRTGTVRLETNVGNGVCGVEFDRKEIAMNKFVVTCLESQFSVYDARTLHPQNGFAHVTEKVPVGATVWGAKHLPQNREISMVLGGDGTLMLYKYRYPDQRQVKDADGAPVGVAGTMDLLNKRNVSTQPISSWDWSPDKEGLAVCGSFDQSIRVVIVTRLNKV
jgi:WD40 repeat protein|tara:strand:- start:1318 stop:2394 length:1077 start_codon:yes stop_codon:yes gene_type:complete|mmetsp:Transcript_9683/g.32012  ORF Transcript_9683/g.32012 Transcript_9683/m.32012 type:complete len:359 (+) Transcript_9683:153-1229(+)